MSGDVDLNWIEDDTDVLFAAIGKYLIIFQWIESLLDKLIILSRGTENFENTQRFLAGLTNKRKIDVVSLAVLTSPDFWRVHTRPEWVLRFKSVVDLLHKERSVRNSIMHSQILFDFADRGMGPPLMSTGLKVTKSTGQVEPIWLSKEYQNELISSISNLALEMSFVYNQLVHDFQVPPRALTP